MEMPFLILKAFHEESSIFTTKEVFLGGTVISLQDEFNKEKNK
jgi:hypothetical protein